MVWSDENKFLFPLGVKPQFLGSFITKLRHCTEIASLSSDCWWCQGHTFHWISFSRLQQKNYLFQVYIHTEKNVLIEINPQTRIPRTFKRFAGLMGKLDIYIWPWAI